MKSTLPNHLRCKACHTEVISVEVEVWPGEFSGFCEPCGHAMVGVLQDAKGRTVILRSVDPSVGAIVPNPPPPPPPRVVVAPKKVVEIPKGIQRKMEPERLIPFAGLEDLLGL